jgi:hypothetical protein
MTTGVSANCSPSGDSDVPSSSVAGSNHELGWTGAPVHPLRGSDVGEAGLAGWLGMLWSGFIAVPLVRLGTNVERTIPQVIIPIKTFGISSQCTNLSRIPAHYDCLTPSPSYHC